MTTLVKADDKGRVSIRGAEEGQQYLVTRENGGWWVMPARPIKTPKRKRRWTGSNKSLAEHLNELANEGLTIEPIKNKVGPCRF